MATPKTPAPITTQAGISSTSIAQAGDGLIRLWVAAFTLPITVASRLGTTLTSLISRVTSELDGTGTSQGTNDIVKATSDLVGATTGLYLTLIKAAVGSLEATTRVINSAVADATESTRK
jgi:tetrahydromethanopterin S-methyltransferase subunit C